MTGYSAARADGTRPTPPADWTRDDWTGLADRMLAAVRPYASPNHARITLPGPEGGYGHAVDGLEGFARTFLLAGFRIAGERGQGLDELADFYARGIAAGVDPGSPERWVRPAERGQAKVEAASIALVLDLTRPWTWDRLSPGTQEQVVEYLAPVVGDDTYPKNNWLWFRVVVQTFLRSVGGPWSADDVAADLALHDSLVREDGWLSDGHERSYDHYVGWALHLYPVLWARMAGAAELAGGRAGDDVARLDRYLLDAVRLVGGDGSPLIEGRSLTYRFAAAAPFWAGVLAGVPSLSPGALRHAANGVVRHFADRGAPDERGLLTMGWHGEWRRLAQSYSGPSSPYWAAKGMLGIALPADHPVWTAPAEPLPVESGDTLFAVRSPGWVVSGTAADGLVRVTNHGTDHAHEGTLTGDSPLYARLGYSTATFPLLDDEAWTVPLEQSVALVDATGRATHRAAAGVIETRVQDDDEGRLGIAGSRALAHWLVPDASQVHHGAGRRGAAEPAGTLTVLSLVRGPWELRLARVDRLAEGVAADGLTLRLGGWPLAGDDAAVGVDTTGAAVAASGLVSSLAPVAGEGRPDVVARRDASPLGTVAHVPTLAFPVRVGSWAAALVGLAGAGTVPDDPCRLALDEHAGGLDATVVWPDGARTRSRLAVPEREAPSESHRSTPPEKHGVPA